MRFHVITFCLFLIAIMSDVEELRANGTPPEHSQRNISIRTVASDSSSCVIPFNRVGNLIVIKARVDTIEGNFILDTGAPNLVLNLTYFRDYPLSTKHDEEQASIAGGGGATTKTTIRQLTFGSMTFEKLDADVTNLVQAIFEGTV